MFRSFGVADFRIWFVGAFLGNVGMWMQNTAQGWAVLTHLTDGGASAMGVALALQFAPPLLLAPVSGWIADRFDRRRLLVLTQAALSALALSIGLLLLGGWMTLPIMLVCAGLLGVITALDLPLRQVFVTDLVPPALVANAVSLNAAALHTARLVGPAAAGLLIAGVGIGWVFVIDALMFLGMIASLQLLRRRPRSPRGLLGRSGGVTAGFRYIAQRPDLIVVFTIVFLIGMLAMNFPIFVSTMALEFDQSADVFGILSSVVAIGSLTGALAAARRRTPSVAFILVGALLYAATATVSSLAPSLWVYAVTLVISGFAVTTALTTSNAYIQTASDPLIRGRVLALYTAVLMGGTAIGAPAMGAVAESAGPRWAIAVAAAGALVAFLIGLTWLIASRRRR